LSAIIAIKAWDTFQHYKDRDPPWIKVYRDLLSSESWVLGTDDSRLVQVASILLAARYHNATPNKFDLFRKVANLDITEKQFRESVAHLASTGFFEIQGDTVSCEQPASSVLALGYGKNTPKKICFCRAGRHAGRNEASGRSAAHDASGLGSRHHSGCATKKARRQACGRLAKLRAITRQFCLRRSMAQTANIAAFRCEAEGRRR
jgi:hypothetical protein